MDSIVFPFYIFYDELEVGNGLGPHAGTNKFGAVYINLACLPPNLASKVKCIIFAALIEAKDKKNYSNQEVFQPLIEEINCLQRTGIDINVNGIEVKVKF